MLPILCLSYHNCTINLLQQCIRRVIHMEICTKHIHLASLLSRFLLLGSMYLLSSVVANHYNICTDRINVHSRLETNSSATKQKAYGKNLRAVLSDADKLFVVLCDICPRVMSPDSRASYRQIELLLQPVVKFTNKAGSISSEYLGTWSG